MLLKNKDPSVHVHAKYQTWIWFQKYINSNGTWSYHINKLLLNEICFTWSLWNQWDKFIGKQIHLSLSNRNKRGEKQVSESRTTKMSIRRAEQTVCGWASSRMFSIVLYCRCHFPFYIPAKNNAHQSMHYLHI